MSKITKQDYIDLFNMSNATDGSYSEYSKLLKRIFGRDDFSGNPDVSSFIDDHKKDPNGAEKFVKYMMKQRPSGQYWMQRDRPKTEKQMKDIFRSESTNVSHKLGVSKSTLGKIQKLYKNTVQISNIKVDQYSYEYVNLIFTKRRGSPSWKLYKFNNKINAESNVGGLQTFESFTDAIDTLNRRYGQELASSSEIDAIRSPKLEIVNRLESIVLKILKENASFNKKSIKEAVSGVNIALPNCNLFVKGWGIDKNGNMRIIVGFPNDKGFPIQTNGTLPETHWTLQRAHRELSESELEVIGDEVLSYVQKHGPANVKSRLKVYGK